jgi:cell pole-organizing protein PopZ
MSDALGSDEIEDVVSSVRRLVSPQVRPRPVSRDLGMDKLLLTPALQVEPVEPRVEPLILTERAIDPEDIASEAPVSEAEVAEAPVVEVPEVEAATHDAPVAEPVVVEPGPFDDLFAPPDEGGTAAPAMAEASPDVTLHVVEGEWEDAFWSEAEPALSEIALEAEEAVVVSADPAPWAQDDGLLTEEAAPKATEADSLGSLTDADGNPVTVLDEAALNEMVRAMIREELQGALGERITQNVRKLVRAEINRVLTARSLD